MADPGKLYLFYNSTLNFCDANYKIPDTLFEVNEVKRFFCPYVSRVISFYGLRM